MHQVLHRTSDSQDIECNRQHAWPRDAHHCCSSIHIAVQSPDLIDTCFSAVRVYLIVLPLYPSHYFHASLMHFLCVQAALAPCAHTLHALLKGVMSLRCEHRWHQAAMKQIIAVQEPLHSSNTSSSHSKHTRAFSTSCERQLPLQPQS